MDCKCKTCKVLQDVSGKQFHNSNGIISKAGKKARLHHAMQAPGKMADMVPGLSSNSLLSTNKLAHPNSITLFTPDKIKIFDGETTNILHRVRYYKG